MNFIKKIFKCKLIKQKNYDKYIENKTILIQEMKKTIGKILTETRKYSNKNEFYDMYICLSWASRLSVILDNINYDEFEVVDEWVSDIRKHCPGADLPVLLQQCNEKEK
jgi:hypothetical protein